MKQISILVDGFIIEFHGYFSTLWVRACFTLLLEARSFFAPVPIPKAMLLHAACACAAEKMSWKHLTADAQAATMLHAFTSPH
jgi:hypothetical protein